MMSINGLPYMINLDLSWAGQVLLFHELMKPVKWTNSALKYITYLLRITVLFLEYLHRNGSEFFKNSSISSSQKVKGVI